MQFKEGVNSFPQRLNRLLNIRQMNFVPTLGHSLPMHSMREEKGQRRGDGKRLALLSQLTSCRSLAQSFLCSVKQFLFKCWQKGQNANRQVDLLWNVSSFCYFVCLFFCLMLTCLWGHVIKTRTKALFQIHTEFGEVQLRRIYKLRISAITHGYSWRKDKQRNKTCTHKKFQIGFL